MFGPCVHQCCSSCTPYHRLTSRGICGELRCRSLAPGQREEDVIQGRPSQCQVVQGHLRSIELTHDGSEELCPLSYRYNEMAPLRVDLEFARTVGMYHACCSMQVTSICHREFESF